jgi:hypothetical protein
MLPGKVNDTVREIMAALAKWYQDSTGSLVTAGTTTAYTVTTNAAHASLADIPVLTIRINAGNTGACTLNVGLGAKICQDGRGHGVSFWRFDHDQLVVVAYNATADRLNDRPCPNCDLIARQVPTCCWQAAAPTGWTLQSTHNNKAIRLVTGGTGGSAAGTTAFTSVFASRTIAEANLPSHAHSSGTYALGDDGIDGVTGVLEDVDTNNGSRPCGSGCNYVNGIDKNYMEAGDLLISDTDVTGSSGSIGSGTAMDFAVQYVDVHWAAKD